MNQLQTAWLLGACSWFWAAPKAHQAPCLPPAASEAEGQESGGHKDESEEHAELPRRVRLTDQVVAAAGIRPLQRPRSPLPATVDLTGEITADPDHAARITARYFWSNRRGSLQEGDRVQAGALLVVLESTDISRTRAGCGQFEARAQAAQQMRRAWGRP